MTEPEKDFNLQQIADAVGMSTRWVREELSSRKGHAHEHRRRGNRIYMSQQQLDKFKASSDVVPVAQSITTGKRRSA